MTKFVEIAVGEIVWLGVRLSSGRTIMLYPSHWVGSCRLPGQRLVRY